MPPRIRCLAPLGVFRQSNLCSKVAFSTTKIASEAPLSQSEIHKLITIEGPNPPKQRPIPPPHSALKRHPSGNANTNQALLNVIGKASQKNNRRKSGVEDSSNAVQSTVNALNDHNLATDLGHQIHRRWKAGDVYSPHDMTGPEMEKWRRRGAPRVDVFDALDMNPIDQYKNFSILSEYMTTMGRIKPIKETGLRRVNQRRIAKAIRRSIGLGLMPSVHRHPEILYNEMLRRGGDPWRRAKNSLVF